MSEKKLIPPFNAPFLVNGEISVPWRNFIDELSKALNKLNVNSG
ncbi:TetR family transcriptional regulator [Acinetobacter sp. WCHAc010034]|nr:TetR family transcriptional regulator [Acinetobacter sp. WCHAc010034]